MEIKISTQQVLKVLQVIAWILFVGICIEAGAIIFNVLYTVFINPNGSFQFYNGLDLSSLYSFDKGYYLVETLIMSIVAILKAIMFYLIIKIAYNKEVSISNPFHIKVQKLIINSCYLTFGIGLFSNWGIKYTNWFVEQGVTMPSIENLGFGGADVWFFTGVILLVISQVFKRGIELQTENELTI